MKQTSFKFSYLLFLVSFTPLFIAQTAFAATPYNALARTLSSNTSKGVYNSTDPLRSDTQISGIVWGKNGSTFIIRLPKDDAGYNVLFTADTVITKNGVATTSKSIVKGIAVTVEGTLDTSTYTIKATNIDLGKSVPASEKPIVVSPQPLKAASSAILPTPKEEKSGEAGAGSAEKKMVAQTKTTTKIITRTLKLGNKNSDVKILQEKLVELGLLSKDATTGYYGPQTVKAVKAFQKKNKLDQVGFIGPKTLTLLNK